MSYRHSIGCSLENLKGIRDFIRGTLRGHVHSEVQLNEIVLALDEMCSNLIIHSHQCNPDDKLELRIQFRTGNQVVFEIVDEGSQFNINEFHSPDLSHLVQEKRKGGLGIRLVKTIMDSVEYTHQGNQNICRLTKRL